jgi:hypothetical protein
LFSGDEALEVKPVKVGWFCGRDAVFDDRDAERAVVCDEGFGATFEDGELAAHGAQRVVNAARSIAADVGADALEDGVGGAAEVDEVGDADEVVDVGGLAEVSWQAVEDDDVIVGGAAVAEEGKQDFAGDGELFVFEERAGMEELADEVEFVGREVPVGGAGGGEAEFVAEVEVDTLPVPEAVAFKDIAERGFAGTGGADDEDRVVDADKLTQNGKRRRGKCGIIRHAEHLTREHAFALEREAAEERLVF